MSDAESPEGSAGSWARPDWEGQAHEWIRVELARLGIRTRGAIKELHVRPWSTVLQVPTVVGSIYFKANVPVLAHEPALTRTLARWRPDCVPQVLASDAARGWLLMADGGTPLRSLIRADCDLDHWRAVLPLYAGLQMEMAAHTAEILAVGAFDRRLARLPRLLEQLLDDTGALRVGRRDGLSPREHRQLRELRPAFEADCVALAAFGIPETLQHDDFHDGNILVAQGRYVFFDWAESAVAHPFFTLVVTLRSIAYSLGMGEEDAGLRELRDIYLEAWTRYGSRADLRAAFVLADRAGRVNRALTWYRVVAGMGEAAQEEYGEAVPGWLREYLGCPVGA
jgi:hypothetical protein